MAYQPDKIPTAAEWGLMRAHLARLGASQQEINQMIGDRRNLTRQQIKERMFDWLKAR